MPPPVIQDISQVPWELVLLAPLELPPVPQPLLPLLAVLGTD
jgi:hypothetical protein